MLEEVLAELDMLSIGLEKTNQWEPQAKVQRIAAIVKRIIGDRNGFQSTSNTQQMLQQSSGASQTSCDNLEAHV
jgi:hypothetical protein